MAITAQMVKELREKTGAGMMDCKKALQETNGDIGQAIDFLREKGMAKAAKKADRVAAEGLTHIEVDGNKAAIIEVNCETDFVTKNDQFKQLLTDLGKHLVAHQPASVEEALQQKLHRDFLSHQQHIDCEPLHDAHRLAFQRYRVRAPQY